ncbi:hypothetical protein SO694_001040118 [Aureococcus anophagefferens]|uniref:Uncharacterized protein n=1 Tax=Aureococcus anophagefferens TaxID=44056 RepID=A0ABR1FML6_AURAN
MPHGSEAVVEAAAAEKTANELQVDAEAAPEAAPLAPPPPAAPAATDAPADAAAQEPDAAAAAADAAPPAPAPGAVDDKPAAAAARRAAAGPRERKDGPRSGARPGGAGRTIWIGAAHRSLKVCHEILGAALPDAVRGFPVTVHAMYEDNVNTACASSASFRDNRNELSFQLDLGACAALAPPAAADALTVASSTDYRVLGGAVANRLRANKVTSLRAIGKKAVWAAMRAVAVAREYTAADDRAATLARTPRPRFFFSGGDAALPAAEPMATGE